MMFSDWLVVIALFFFVGTHVVTGFYLSHQAERNGVDLATVAKVQEASPGARWVFGLSKARAVLTFLVIPAQVIGLYYIARRWGSKELRDLLAVFFVSVAALNLANDLSILLGVLL